MNGERRVGGLWCHEVLEHLSDYLDGAAGEAVQKQIETHLAQCTTCSRFGDEVAAVIGAIRTRLGEADPLPSELLRRVARAPGEG